jgi:hypothetical protein
MSGILRPILIIPHALLVGGPIGGVRTGAFRAGALGMLAATIALLDWFAILFRGHSLAGMQGLKRLYLHWRARVVAYGFFLRDEYPPFGDDAYPASLELPEEPATRSFTAVLLRPILIIPHLVVLAVLIIVQVVVTVIAWLSITFTGKMGDAVWRFGRDTGAYLLRVEAYGLLIHDDYPPFKFTAPEPEPAPPPPATPPAT